MPPATNYLDTVYLVSYRVLRADPAQNTHNLDPPPQVVFFTKPPTHERHGSVCPSANVVGGRHSPISPTYKIYQVCMYHSTNPPVTVVAASPQNTQTNQRSWAAPFPRRTPISRQLAHCWCHVSTSFRHRLLCFDSVWTIPQRLDRSRQCLDNCVTTDLSAPSRLCSA